MPQTPDLDLWAVRHVIYQHFADHGVPPPRAALVEFTGSIAAARRWLDMLHEEHQVVLDASGEVRMALPFSGVPTEHRVRTDRRAWMANCAWDALAIPVVVEADVDIESRFSDTREPCRISISDGELGSTEGYVHFEMPAARWWDDIVRT